MRASAETVHARKAVFWSHDAGHMRGSGSTCSHGAPDMAVFDMPMLMVFTCSF